MRGSWHSPLNTLQLENANTWLEQVSHAWQRHARHPTQWHHVPNRRQCGGLLRFDALLISSMCGESLTIWLSRLSSTRASSASSCERYKFLRMVLPRLPYFGLDIGRRFWVHMAFTSFYIVSVSRASFRLCCRVGHPKSFNIVVTARNSAACL